MTLDEKLEILQTLQEKYDTMKAEIHGERLNTTVKLDLEIAKKEQEYAKLLKEIQLTDAKIDNTQTMKDQKSWQRITDILDGRA